jgi:hypothetical protein
MFPDSREAYVMKYSLGDGCKCRHIFATLSFIAETFIFLYVGMDALDIDKWKTSKAR